MNTELATDLLLKRLLQSEQGNAAFIEVGLGSGDWSFRWASSMGFHCIAVEPVPIPSLSSECSKRGITLIEAAAGSVDGWAMLYRGELNGHPIPDTSSMDPDWWAVGSTALQTRVVTLASVLATTGSVEIACLKIDVEGAEADVLAGLTDLNKGSLPGYVAFEYGGGGCRESKVGGWNAKGIKSTFGCLEQLVGLGYTWGVMCERVESKLRRFELMAAMSNRDDFFSPRAEVGNLIVGRSSAPIGLNELLKSIERQLRRQAILSSIGANFGAFVFHVRRYRAAVSRRLLGR